LSSESNVIIITAIRRLNEQMKSMNSPWKIY
jgi:hypothetical protein